MLATATEDLPDPFSDFSATVRRVSSATTAADVRFSTLSLLKMCSTCLQMVPVQQSDSRVADVLVHIEPAA